MLRTLAVVSALTIALTASASAEAATGDQFFTCEFHGVAGFFDTPVFLASPTSGKYEFSGRANCAYVNAARQLAVIPDADGNASISSNGDFEVAACGVGWASDLDGGGTSIDIDDDAITVGGGTAASIPTISGVGYEAPFAGGAGALHIGGESINPDTLGQALGGSWRGSGVLDIFPEPVNAVENNCVNDPITQVSVSGVFSAVGF